MNKLFNYNKVPRIAITGGSGFIGTNLVDFFLNNGNPVINLDVSPPRCSKHTSVWYECNIEDKNKLYSIITKFDPQVILHFAAHTNLSGKSELDYLANTLGVKNIIQVSSACRNLSRIIFASSQLVCRVGYKPISTNDYCPNTLYGKSKVNGEEQIKSSKISTPWTIIRPTSIWGPWFDIPYKPFFETLRKGIFVFPSHHTTLKQWGFVYNSIFQIIKLLQADRDLVNEQVFYLADYQALDLLEFSNLVAYHFNKAPVHEIPRWMLSALAHIGDLLATLNIKNIPLTSFRLNNILVDEIQDNQNLKQITGDLPFSVVEGIQQTINWMENENIKSQN